PDSPRIETPMLAPEPESAAPAPEAPAPETSEPASPLAEARAQADLGNLSAALALCERALAADRHDPVAYYLHAVILQEAARPAEAEAALGRALYLDPDFALAHYGLAR